MSNNIQVIEFKEDIENNPKGDCFFKYKVIYTSKDKKYMDCSISEKHIPYSEYITKLNKEHENN